MGRGSDLKQGEAQQAENLFRGSNTLPILLTEGVLEAYLNQNRCCSTRHHLASISFKYEWQAQQLTDGPDVVGEASRHGRRSLPVPSLQPGDFQAQ
jgi:hypothetical protein